FVAKRKRTSNHLGIPAELPLPQTVAQHHYFAAVGRILLRSERPSQHHRSAEYVKIALRYMDSVNLLWLSARDVIPRPAKVVCGNFFEEARLPLKRFKLGH